MKTKSYTSVFWPAVLAIAVLAFPACNDDDDDGNGAPDYPHVTDVDGNHYRIIELNDRKWTAENLRTTRYNNGDPIITGLDDDEWRDTTEGAYSIYPHVPPLGEIKGIDSPQEMVDAYGKLYNWYAVTDPRGLCPEGWRAPTDLEWYMLVHYLKDEYGLENEWDSYYGVGNALKSCRQLDSPEGGSCDVTLHPRWNKPSDPGHYGTDDFGYSLLPAGNRYTLGPFSGIGAYGKFWTSSEYSPEKAWRYRASHSGGSFRRDQRLYTEGYSVRCIKEEDNND